MDNDELKQLELLIIYLYFKLAVNLFSQAIAHSAQAQKQEQAEEKEQVFPELNADELPFG